jgi:hypothetical protein
MIYNEILIEAVLDNKEQAFDLAINLFEQLPTGWFDHIAVIPCYNGVEVIMEMVWVECD